MKFGKEDERLVVSSADQRFQIFLRDRCYGDTEMGRWHFDPSIAFLDKGLWSQKYTHILPHFITNSTRRYVHAIRA